MGESTQMKSGATWQKVVVRAYLVSLGLAVLVIVLTTLLMDTSDCYGSVQRGLLVMFATMVVVLLASVVVVGVRVWKAIPTLAERLAIVVGYGAMMLASFVVITCGLMVVFNC
jgi:membrane-associated HD superfamily phosphohydrolase